MNGSLWRETAEMPSFDSLKENKKTDVLIIGGGIAGILLAHFLRERGVKYMLVEKGRICCGTTENTTAKLTLSHGLVYHKILKNYGEETALKYLQGNQWALEKYAELCKNIDCDYEIKDSYVYSLDDRRKIEDEVRALERLGYKAELCEKLSIPIKTVGAIKCKDQAQFHPLKFLSAIAKDLNIYENTWVRDVLDNRAVTDRYHIDANKIVIATHFPFIDRFGGYYLKMYQHRSYVLALDNAARCDGMYVDESKTGFSFRGYKNMLLLGGGGHRTGKKGGDFEELRNFADIHYPDASERYRWAAQDCMTLDGIPYIGTYAQSVSGLYLTTGFNKWGMSGAMLSAMMLSDMLCGVKNEFSEAFYPLRSIFHPQLAINGFETLTNILRPTAPRCTHLGCALKWNKAEKSWDCACHGSRFSADGRVINNPANRNLK